MPNYWPSNYWPELPGELAAPTVSGGLTASELAALRAAAEAWLQSTCTIQAKTEAVDATGGITATWADTYTGIACRLDPLSPGSETVRNFALEGQSAWMLYLKYDQAITLENRVVYGSNTYEVRAVQDKHGYITVTRAVLVKVD
jgi:head-tail adaptor